MCVVVEGGANVSDGARVGNWSELVDDGLLSPEHRRALDEQGFVVLHHLLGGAAVTRLEAGADDLVRAGGFNPAAPEQAPAADATRAVVRQLIEAADVSKVALAVSAIAWVFGGLPFKLN